jgi:amino acid transporter
MEVESGAGAVGAKPAGEGGTVDANGRLTGVERLKGGQLRLHEVVYQNLCNMAPGAAIGYDFYLIGAATAAGAAMGLVSVIGSVLVICAAITVAQFAKRLPSAGGFYTYISHGMGHRMGAFSGLMFFLYSLVLPAEVTVIWAGLTQDLVKKYIGWNVSWVFWEILIVTAVTTLAYFGIKRSAKVAMVTGTIEIVIFAALGVSCLLKPASPISFAPFDPGSAPKGWSGIMAFGLVYTILNFVGFEAAAPIAEETANPRRNIGRSVIFSAVLASVLYTFLSFAVVPGWGIHNWAAFTAGGPDSWTVLANKYWGIGWLFIYFAMTNSSVGCCLAVTNNASRVLYAMGRIHLLPSFLGRVHHKYKTPHLTIFFMWAFTLVAALVAGLIWGYLNGFGVLAAILTIGAMISYVLANIALPIFVWREDRAHFSWFTHILFPVIAGVVMAYVCYRTVWPIPAYPYNVPGYFAIGWLLAAVAVTFYLVRRRPEAIAKGKLLVALDE